MDEINIFSTILIISAIGFVAVENKFIRPLFSNDKQRDRYNLIKGYLGILALSFWIGGQI